MKRKMRINVRHIDNNIERFKKIEIGDRIDVRMSTCAIVHNDKKSIANGFKKCQDLDSHEYKAGDVVICRLGFAMELPQGYEAEVVSRSGTFKETGLILTNALGVIDESYKGDNDEWMAVFLATRDGVINKGDRIGQFRIDKKMPEVEFNYVEFLGNKNRGGYNSTGMQ